MQEYLTELEKAFRTSAAAFAISILAGVSRTILSEEKRTFFGYCRGLILAIFVACVASNFLSGYGISEGVKTCFIAVAAFSADDILISVIKLTKMIRNEPARIFDIALKIIGRR